MKSTLAPVPVSEDADAEDGEAAANENLVKVSVEVDEAEFEEAVDGAFRRIAREVRIPGFRPGKAPRKILEARIGIAVAREEALREAVPEYYARAVRELDVDVIAPPDLDITDGHESGPVLFDAVVEIRPEIRVFGYADLTVEIPAPTVSDADIDEQVDRLRSTFGSLETVDRPIIDGDHVTMNIATTQSGEPLDGLTADGYVYEVGKRAIVPEIDENLHGKKPGDVVEFEAAYPDPDADEDDLAFRILVKEVQQTVLPDVDDDWAAEASEFETVDELRADFEKRLAMSKRLQANMALREKTAEAVAALVHIDIPEALLSGEMEQRLQEMAMRLAQQGIDPEQFFASQDRTALTAELREAAEQAARVDLALRAIAAAEELEPTDEDIEAEIASIAAQWEQDVEAVRHEFEHHRGLGTIRSDLSKRSALEWVLERCEIIDEDGNPVDRDDLEFPTEDSSESAAAEEGSAESDTETAEAPDAEKDTD